MDKEIEPAATVVTQAMVLAAQRSYRANRYSPPYIQIRLMIEAALDARES